MVKEFIDPVMESIDKFLELSMERGASELLLVEGKTPMWLFDKRSIYAFPFAPLTARDMIGIVQAVLDGSMTDAEISLLTQAEVPYEIKNVGRFRASIFRHRGQYRVLFRLTQFKMPTLEDLNLPSDLIKITDQSHGLVLVTGATGNGKSATIAALVNHINMTRKTHIVSIEDPIEYIYPDGEAIVTQREVGYDVEDYQTGVYQALRQSASVVMLGEVRDRETLEAALEAAESGHLVFTAIHTADTVRTIDRILGFYPYQEWPCIRERLANCLYANISLRLVRSNEKTYLAPRIPAVEIMKMNDMISELLRSNGSTKKILSCMEKGAIYGMQTFDNHLFDLYKREAILLPTALAHATNPDDLKTRLTQENIIERELSTT
jgi:twitching motility protein PilT